MPPAWRGPQRWSDGGIQDGAGAGAGAGHALRPVVADGAEVGVHPALPEGEGEAVGSGRGSIPLPAFAAGQAGQAPRQGLSLFRCEAGLRVSEEVLG
jgi:hypothetical protein